MNTSDPTGNNWSNQEVDLIVADYFDMLQLELSGKPFVKLHRNKTLQDLTGRSKGSIEFKHQNISAVLRKLGMPWISGYKPLPNFQGALVDGVERYLEKGDALTLTRPDREHNFAERPSLFYEAPPIANIDREPTTGRLERLVRKFDPAARDERNRKLGKEGEESILFFERSRLKNSGHNDLANKVRWVSQEDGDGAGYDILSFDVSGAERLLEVKTTNGHQTTPFYLSENERLLSMERPNAFRLVRLYDFARAPKVFELVPPLESSVMLKPINYQASF